MEHPNAQIYNVDNGFDCESQFQCVKRQNINNVLIVKWDVECQTRRENDVELELDSVAITRFLDISKATVLTINSIYT